MSDEITKLRQENERLSRENATMKDYVADSMRERKIEWHSLPPDMQQIREFAVEAIERCGVPWKDVPEPCRSNPATILAALRFDAQYRWQDVEPESLKTENIEIALFGIRKSLHRADDCPCLWGIPQNDIELARSIVEQSPRPYLVGHIFAQFPSLCVDRSMWMKAFDTTAFLGGFAYLIDQYAPAQIRSDRELMLKACSRDENVWRLLFSVDERIATDHHFLLEVAARNYCVLAELSHELQRRFPDVVACALQRATELQVGGNFCMIAARNLLPDFWDNRDFVLRWFRLGLPFLHFGPFLQTEWITDKEIFLLIAKHCHPECRRLSFKKAAMSLRRDKKFMSQVLKVDPSLWPMVEPELRSDFDLRLLAFSGDLLNSEVERVVRHRRTIVGFGHCNENENLEAFRRKLSERLRSHNIFSTIVLPAMSQKADSGCHLAALNQGSETSRNYKKRMAEYLDVPTQKRLRLHREASRNVNALLDNENN